MRWVVAMRSIGASTLLAVLVLGAGAPAGDRETEMRLQANEISAIASLRNLSSAQAQFQAMAFADEDSDGTGEFGTLGELSATVPVRGTKRVLSPPVLSTAWKRVQPDGTVRRNGYAFAVFLPGKGGEPAPEAGGGGIAAGFLDPALAARIYVAYAWPLKRGETGRRAFVLNQRGDVLGTDAAYHVANRPLPNAAFLADEGDDLVVGEMNEDGRRWSRSDAWPLIMQDQPADPVARLALQRMLANETAARVTLRNLLAAQAQFQVAAVVDEDNDGIGEFGTFAEMAGRLPARGSTSKLNPPVLSEAFKTVAADGTFSRAGYRFAIWLPGPGGKGVRESKDGLPAGKVDVNLAETAFLAYAWPEKTGSTGRHTFAVDGEGTEVCTVSKDHSGDAAPRPGAALKPRPTPTRIDRPLAKPGEPAADGWVWKLVN